MATHAPKEPPSSDAWVTKRKILGPQRTCLFSRQHCASQAHTPFGAVVVPVRYLAARRERDPALVSSGQCVVPTVRGFYMFNTVTNSRNYMARVSKLEIALRWAPDVRQVCSGSVPAFFLRCLAWFATAPFHCFPS